MIIGITGTLGAGKGAIVEYLKKKGFKHYSTTYDCIVPEIEKRGLVVNRDSMVLVANDLRAKNGSGYIAEYLFERAEKEGGNIVMESIRTEGEIIALKKRGTCIMFSVDAKPEIRYERNLKRKSSKDNVTYEKFLEDEKREFSATDPTKQNLSRCIELADYVFQNNGSFEELYAQVEEALKKIGEQS
ncbi:AAA family ATPase [archaeon]|nr:AAA family ATPase [archaeon]MBL7057439.1 AAA family ATPase [Candidatus Woesearchaeota archaeon]